MEIARNQKILLGGLVSVILVALIFLLDRMNVRTTTQIPNDKGVTLSLEPQSKTVKLGEIFKVDIILDTANSLIDGADVYALRYDPSVLQVIDDLPGQQGIQIQPGTVLPVMAGNIVDETVGAIKLGMVSNPGTNFTGQGILATVHFKAIKTGGSDLKFDFTTGSTVDTNAAFGGQDQLKQVINASYSVEP